MLIGSLALNNKRLNETVGKNTSTQSLFFPLKSNIDLGIDAQHKTLQQKVKDKLISIGTENLENLGGALADKFRDKRGQLIEGLTGQLRASINLPKIYPDNVYSEDFDPTKITPKKFLKGLASDAYNTAENSTKKELGGSLGAFGL